MNLYNKVKQDIQQTSGLNVDRFGFDDQNETIVLKTKNSVCDCRFLCHAELYLITFDNNITFNLIEMQGITADEVLTDIKYIYEHIDKNKLQLNYYKFLGLFKFRDISGLNKKYIQLNGLPKFIKKFSILYKQIPITFG